VAVSELVVAAVALPVVPVVPPVLTQLNGLEGFLLGDLNCFAKGSCQFFLFFNLMVC